MEFPKTWELVVAQVKTLPELAEAVGAVVLEVTTAVAVEVQLLAGFVTVTVYVPAVLTDGLWLLEVKPPGPLQEYVTFGVGELAEIVTLGELQVIVAPVALAPGGFAEEVTVVEAVAVQPFTLLVTCNV